jgi:hypothetical protein
MKMQQNEGKRMEVENQFGQLSPDECRKLAAVMLLTDGCVKRRSNRNAYQIVYYGKDAILHQIFKLLIVKGLGGKPSSFMQPAKRSYQTVFERGLKSQCTNAIFSLTPSFKTSPGRQDKKEYATMQSPTIKFLFTESLRVKILAFRLAMSADGNVAIINNGSKFRLRLGCAHPALVKEWKTLAEKLGISMNLARDKNTWSGIQGLNTDRKKNLLKFSGYGGFIDNVRAHKSLKYRGF